MFEQFAAVASTDVALMLRRGDDGNASMEAYAADSLDPQAAESHRPIMERVLPKEVKPGTALRTSKDGKMLVASIGTEMARAPSSWYSFRLAVPFKSADRWTNREGLELARTAPGRAGEYGRREIVRLRAERELRANETELKSLFENSRDMSTP
jgi:hypothetical protein